MSVRFEEPEACTREQVLETIESLSGFNVFVVGMPPAPPLACFHTSRHIPTLLNLVEVSRGTTINKSMAGGVRALRSRTW